MREARIIYEKCLSHSRFRCRRSPAVYAAYGMGDGDRLVSNLPPMRSKEASPYLSIDITFPDDGSTSYAHNHGFHSAFSCFFVSRTLHSPL